MNMALSKPGVESFQEDLSCGICERKLQDGQFLKCFHSFCKKCLQGKKDAESNSMQRGMIANVASGVFRVAAHMFTTNDVSSDQDIQIACPVCTKEGKPPGPDSRQYVFPNVLADVKIDNINFTEKVKSKAELEKLLSCESCQENDATVTSYCVDCGQFICKPCVAAHKKLSLTRGHALIEVDDIQNGRALIDVKREKANPKCHVHPSCTISQLCTICQIAICSECRDTDLHRLHPSLELTEGLKPFLIEARILVEKMGPERFDKSISEFLQHKKEIAETAELLKKQVNEDAQAACAEVLKQVEDRRLAVMAKISRIQSESNKATDDIIKEMELLRIRANKTFSYIDILHSSGTNADILGARSGGFLDYLRDLGTEVNSKGSCKTNATLKLHTKSFPFPRYQVKWYTPLYTE